MSSNSDCDAISRCANCGVGEGDGIKLKICTACKSVKYCGITCQKQHRPFHKQECKKRAAEIKDEILFRQTEGNFLGDCPICFLPMPYGSHKGMLMVCCGKFICVGCCMANQMREVEEGKDRKCPFCRQLSPVTYAKSFKMLNERATEKNCTRAMREVGITHYNRGEFQTAFKYYSKAAEEGELESHKMLGEMYLNGKGVERNLSKALSHTETAAIGGHPGARYNLGSIEYRHGQHERAIKHWLISAKAGHNQSLEDVKQVFKGGLVSKDDFAAALRGHQAAVDATKSLHREKAAEYLKTAACISNINI